MRTGLAVAQRDATSPALAGVTADAAVTALAALAAGTALAPGQPQGAVTT